MAQRRKQQVRSGTITSFDGSQGVIRLDDGGEVVFFRYSFAAVTPAVGMAVEVRKTEPFHKGGVRATDLGVVGQRLDRNAKLDRSWAVDHLRVEQARQREALEAERRNAEQAVEAFDTRWLEQHPAPAQPALETLFDGQLPAPVKQLIARSSPLTDAPPLTAPADPAFVPVMRAFGWSIGFMVHPELPLELGLANDHSACALTIATSGLHAALEFIDAESAVLTEYAGDDELPPGEEDASRERGEELETLFRPPTAARADGALVTSWLDAVHAARSRGSRDEQGAVLLDFYRERGWSKLASRLHLMMEHLSHHDEWRAAQVAFLRGERGKTLSEGAADELLREYADED